MNCLQIWIICTNDSIIYPVLLYRRKALTRIKLTFFIVVPIVDFGYVTIKMLTTHQCFGYCQTEQHQDFISFHAVDPASELGVEKRLGGYTDHTADPNWPKRTSTYRNLSFQIAVLHAVGLLSRKFQNIYLTMESSEGIPYFAFLGHLAFLHLLNLIRFSIHEFWIFALLIFFPILL